MRKITTLCIVISVIFLVGCGNRLRIVREPKQDIETAEKIQLTDIEKKLDEVKVLYLKDETKKAKKLIYEILSMIDKENRNEIKGQLNDLLKEIKKKE